MWLLLVLSHIANLNIQTIPFGDLKGGHLGIGFSVVRLKDKLKINLCQCSIFKDIWEIKQPQELAQMLSTMTGSVYPYS